MLPEKNINIIKQLREAGLSYKQIGEKLDIPHTLAFYYSKDVRDTHNRVHLQVKNKMAELLERGKNLDGAVLEIGDVPFAVFELPFTLSCLYCGRSDEFLVLCLRCGVFVCQGCGEAIDIATARLERQLSLT